MTYLIKAPNGLNTESQALAAALAQIEKQFGKGTIMKLGAGEVIRHPGGVHRLVGLTLPWAWADCRAAGWWRSTAPSRRQDHADAAGDCRDAKSAAPALCRCRACAGHPVRVLGVNLQELLISQPDNGEQALEMSIR
jgi:recombination protein RecA